ncbi:MAG TPA: NUDIX hydrolase [Myxococcaceae bacterium]|nr:NUDIX hydrolase [Myxococcaceae bacterium]
MDAEWPRVKGRLQRGSERSGREVLLELLGAHVPEDGKERADLDSMREHARTLEDPFSRAQPRAHFTASAVVVSPDGARVCLVHHRKLQRWLQPGGHVEAADEQSLELCALREAAEETGLEVRLEPAAPQPLDVDIHRIPDREGERAHLHLDVRYLVRARDADALLHDPSESFGARWLTWDEALAAADEPALQRLLSKAKRYLR